MKLRTGLLLAVIVLILAVAGYGAAVLVLNDGLPFRKMRTVSESMAPTLRSGTTITARKRAPAELRRGDIAVFSVGDSFWIMRVAGLPGDRIGMRDGVVILNGKPIAQTDAGKLSIEGREARVRTERLPGEAQSHRVLDLEPTQGDNVPDVTVPARRLFVLGDNRDNAADSRFPAGPVGGSGLVSFENVYGIVPPEEIDGG
ncbi:signal peptidase I [Sphingomonas sp. LT1P40]|uniref:signal peptidase I n=1 Tax=Alteristakelama amylovorans TaxID=3096166 RepID=UPI002FCB844A